MCQGTGAVTRRWQYPTRTYPLLSAHATHARNERGRCTCRTGVRRRETARQVRYSFGTRRGETEGAIHAACTRGSLGKPSSIRLHACGRHHSRGYVVLYARFVVGYAGYVSTLRALEQFFQPRVPRCTCWVDTEGGLDMVPTHSTGLKLSVSALVILEDILLTANQLEIVMPALSDQPSFQTPTCCGSSSSSTRSSTQL